MIGPVLPYRLRPGDLIGVMAPAGPGPTQNPRRFQRAIATLERWGFEVVVGPVAASSGEFSPEARAEEVNAFLRDHAVRALIASIGGLSTNAILPLVDYAALAEDPKVLIGYSDITALLLGCHAVTGTVVFHGPTMLPELGEFPGVSSFTEHSLLRAVTGPSPLGRFEQPRLWTEQFLAWDVQDNVPRRHEATEPWTWLGRGRAQGHLLGGNLDTLSILCGTPFLPRLEGSVLFWETMQTSLPDVDRLLTHLEHAGAFAGIVAMLVGRTFRGPAGFEATFRDFLADRLSSLGIPVVAGIELGHTDPMLTLPIGVQTVVDRDHRVVEVIGAAVRERDEERR